MCREDRIREGTGQWDNNNDSDNNTFHQLSAYCSPTFMPLSPADVPDDPMRPPSLRVSGLITLWMIKKKCHTFCVHSFLYSFNKCVLGIQHLAGTVLSTGDSAEEQTDQKTMPAALTELAFLKAVGPPMLTNKLDEECWEKEEAWDEGGQGGGRVSLQC